jgi:hypothetical protein
LVEFHPLIILYITTKITQKTTIFNGISKLSQSICTFSFYLQFQVAASYLAARPSSTENKWLKSDKCPWREVPGRPVLQLTKSKNPQKSGILHRSLGVSGLTNTRGPLVLIHRLSTSYCG